MPLSPGTRLGTYEIAAPLGAGGTGVVYRARDTKLDRDVALKTLPESFAHDVERLTRFEREAKTLAARLFYDVMPDERFLMMTPIADALPTSLTLTVNWPQFRRSSR